MKVPNKLTEADYSQHWSLRVTLFLHIMEYKRIDY